MRAKGLAVDYDIMNRGFKPQFKYADKIGAKFVVIIGEDEIASQSYGVKDMSSGMQEQVAKDSAIDYIVAKVGR